MDSVYQTFAYVKDFQIGVSMSIGGNPPQSVNIITFDSDFAKVGIHGDSPTGYAEIVKPAPANPDTNRAEELATGKPPRVLQYNKTGGIVDSLPAYSIATSVWDNGYQIAIDDIVVFSPAINGIWNLPRTIGNVDVSSTLVSEESFRPLHHDVALLSAKVKNVEDVVGIDLSQYLLSDYSVESDGKISLSGALQIAISSGELRYKGKNFTYAGGSFSTFTDKSLALIEVKTDGTIIANTENSAGGTPDADYNPSGSSPLPTAATPIWTASGTASSETVANGVFTLATSSNYRVYDRAGVAGPPASGSTCKAIVQWVSGTGNRIEIDDGTYRAEVSIEQGQIVLQNDLQKYSFDTSIPFFIRITLKSGITNVYVNGVLKISSQVTLSTIANRFRFGCYASYSGSTPQNTTSSMRVARIVTTAAGAITPTFSANQGVVVGSAVVINSAFSPSIGIQLSEQDVELGYRQEKRLACLSDLLLPYYNKVGTVIEQSSSILRIENCTTYAENIGSGKIAIAVPFMKYVKFATTGLGGILQSANLTGTISVSSGTATVTGSGTSFSTDFVVGDPVTTVGGQSRRIVSIASATSMTVESNWSSTETGVTYKRGGFARNTMYYIYAVLNPTTGDTNYVVSARSGNNRRIVVVSPLVDLPSGYSLVSKPLFAYRTRKGSETLLPQSMAGNFVAFRQMDLNHNTPTAGETFLFSGDPASYPSFTRLDLAVTSAFIPKTALSVLLDVRSAGSIYTLFRENSSAASVSHQVILGSAGLEYSMIMACDSAGGFEISDAATSANVIIYAAGYYIEGI